MPNEILKTIKIDVNSSEYKALLKSLNSIHKIEIEINKLNDSTNKRINNRINFLKEELILLNKNKNAEIEAGRLTEASYKLKRKDLNNTIKQLELQKKLNSERKRSVKIQRETNLIEAKNNAKNKYDAFIRNQQRKKWEEGKPNFFELGERYKGVGGAFNLLQDQAERKGYAEVEEYDRIIASKEKEKEQNRAEMENIYAQRYGEGSEKLSKEEKAKLTKKFNQLKAKNEQIDIDIETAKDDRSKSIGNTKTQMNKYAAMAQAAEKVSGQLKKVAGVLFAPFKALANATMDAVKQMIDFKTGVATYNTANSLITNSTAREQQMRYGLTSSQNYAFTQAKQMLNIQSDEDLMFMNVEQREKFLSYMDRYSQWYNKMEASGVLNRIQEMQLEFAEFKQEIAMEFLQWVAENKETIMACIKGIFEFVKGIANFVMGILKIISLGKYNGDSIAKESDYNNTVNNNQKSTVININANTTNNATGVLGSQEAFDAYNKENFNKLAKQIATAMGG